MYFGSHAGINVVSVGGGTGLSTLLSGLKKYVVREHVHSHIPGWPCIADLAAVVTVTDDGGSSGRLREEFQILPPGDIRNCLAALAEDEALLTQLFQHRFNSEGSLSNHSFGNIFLTALTSVTGDFLEAIKLTSEVLAIKGRIFPSTMEDVTLIAELESGEVIHGETNIVKSRSRIRKLRLSQEKCSAVPEALDAIRRADLITIGPGSLYTSLIPNLLVPGIVDAINDSQAIKVFIGNIMTQPGETDGFMAEDHLIAIYKYSPTLKLDCVVSNTTPISSEQRERYRSEGAIQVRFESQAVQRIQTGSIILSGLTGTGRQFDIICGDLLNEDKAVRHNPDKLARLLLGLCAGKSSCSEQASGG